MKSPHLDDQTKQLLDVGVGGVFLRPSRLDQLERLNEAVADLKSYAGRPVFVAVDHELAVQNGGDGPSRLPGGARLQTLEDRDLAREVGHFLGRELRQVGVDVTLGPVLDVATKWHNPVTSGRALGHEPDVVAALCAALVEGQQAEGVAACGKHFPGHGDTNEDSRFQLPALAYGMDRLEAVELMPFERCIAERMAGVLVGHILLHRIDAAHPASLSRTLIHGLLRQRLGYRGFVITDDVDMGALCNSYSTEEVAALGLAAGVDSFLCARRPERALDLVDAIVRGVETGTIFVERLEAARRRGASLVHRFVRGPGSTAPSEADSSASSQRSSS